MSDGPTQVHIHPLDIPSLEAKSLLNYPSPTTKVIVVSFRVQHFTAEYLFYFEKLILAYMFFREFLTKVQ